VEHCDIGFSTPSGGTRSVVEGIDGVGVNDWVIRNNRFVNIQKGGAEAYALFTKGNSSGTIVDGNLFVGCFIGASFGGGGTAPQFFRDGDQRYEHRGGIVRNNVMIRTTDAGIYMNKALGCEIDNNTLFECELTIQLRFAATSGRLANNLVKPAPDNASEPLVRIRDGATLLEQHATLAATDADFLEPSGAADQLDLHLSPGSHAIDAGVAPATPVTSDFDGRPRPSGAAIDVGAFEHPEASGVRTETAGTAEAASVLALREATADAWIIDVRSGGAWRLALYDLLGRVIASRTGAATAGTELAIGHAGLSAGVYLLRLEPDGAPARTLVLRR
jgi:parallel beta-helix repeat protein